MIERLNNVHVTVVFNSGTKNERTATAEVLGVDPGWDLAILKVKHVEDLPEPISSTKIPELAETMQVFTLGYPLGNMLGIKGNNPAITVGKASISSLRQDQDGDLAIVQIDGNLSPGNSGGPVVDGRGQLVGIAVAIMREGNGIGLLIPAVELRKTLEQGRIGEAHLFRARVGDVQKTVDVEVARADPMENMASMSLLYVPASQALKLPADIASLENLPGQKDQSFHAKTVRHRYHFPDNDRERPADPGRAHEQRWQEICR